MGETTPSGLMETFSGLGRPAAWFAARAKNADDLSRQRARLEEFHIYLKAAAAWQLLPLAEREAACGGEPGDSAVADDLAWHLVRYREDLDVCLADPDIFKSLINDSNPPPAKHIRLEPTPEAPP